LSVNKFRPAGVRGGVIREDDLADRENSRCGGAGWKIAKILDRRAAKL
jgi:hypothetical protein